MAAGQGAWNRQSPLDEVARQIIHHKIDLQPKKGIT
jgi:hypothetical protein